MDYKLLLFQLQHYKNNYMVNFFEGGITIGYCIYYMKTEQLHFNKQEHIIPAALGGIQKLDHGVVSDEANEKFSKIELNAIRNSPININRTKFGPGKRGRLTLKKLKSPVIKVLNQEENNGLEFPLGFIFSGESYIIPQLYLDIDDEKNTCFSTYLYSTFIDKIPIEFKSDFNAKLIQFLMNKQRIYKLVKMSFDTEKHFISIGYYEGKWYAATSHQTINMDMLALHVLLPMLKEQAQTLIQDEEEAQPQALSNSLFKYQDQFQLETSSFFFLYLKTAFNALAYFKGSEFVCKDIFDELRDSILNMTNIVKFIEEDKQLFNSSIKNYINKFPQLSHYVILCAREEILMGYVSFYGEQPAIIKITDKYQGENFTHGLICDWKNRSKELLLENFIWG